MKLSSLLLASLLVTGSSSALPANQQGSDALVSSPVVGHEWIAKNGANLCGISKLKRVTNPAVVDYDALMAATPQMKEMKGKGIKPDSIEGKTLREAARKLIVTKASGIQRDGGYCGLWKAISHKDGRAIDDVTADIIALF